MNQGSQEFLVAVTPWLDRFEPNVRTSLAQFIATPLKIGADELARRSVVSRRTFDRQLRAAGVPGTYRFMRVARLAAMWEDLAAVLGPSTHPGRLPNRVRLRTLRLQCRSLLGAAPRELRRDLTAVQFAALLMQAMFGGRGPRAQRRYPGRGGAETGSPGVNPRG
jgi:hypothetical protein